MKVIVGSSELWPTPALASKILAIMVSTESDFGVRARGNWTRHASDDPYWTSMTEELAAKIGDRLGKSVVSFIPMEAGSSTAFKRDVRLVKAADEVFAFFGPQGEVEGGTAHVVACALREGIPVTAYGLDDDGSIMEIGHDGGEFYVNTYSHTPTVWLPDEEIGWRK